ncbi:MULTISPECIES: TspO/MBR family protein [unclassified Luteococcus]|uniref:TspO/MBR family protein n=1 Tax=unclassified Luteococcus TaxID=2639923 RepID=UPI00313D91F5
MTTLSELASAGTRNPWAMAVVGTALCAVSGSVATDTRSRWYKSIDKPAWQPPGVVFPFVWTALYSGLAATTGRVLTELDESDRQQEATGFRRAFVANLVLNQGWSWTFFRSHRLGLATANAALLAASSIDLARRAERASEGKGAELAPYAAWCSFATLLTASIARRNS